MSELLDINMTFQNQYIILVIQQQQQGEEQENKEQLDGFGFIMVPKEYWYERRLRMVRTRMRDSFSRSTGGKGKAPCKGLCKHLPHVDSRRISYKRTGHYYCSECGIAMKCFRCRCCGHLGRSEPRQRKRLSDPNMRFVE